MSETGCRAGIQTAKLPANHRLTNIGPVCWPVVVVGSDLEYTVCCAKMSAWFCDRLGDNGRRTTHPDCFDVGTNIRDSCDHPWRGFGGPTNPWTKQTPFPISFGLVCLASRSAFRRGVCWFVGSPPTFGASCSCAHIQPTTKTAEIDRSITTTETIETPHFDVRSGTIGLFSRLLDVEYANVRPTFAANFRSLKLHAHATENQPQRSSINR